MKAIIETSTGLALYMFPDAETVTITGTGLIVNGREHATDIRPETHSIATTTKPIFWRGAQVTWNGSAWTYNADTLDEYKAELISEVAKKRWETETGGVTVSNTIIDTTRESQGLITGAYNLALRNTDTVGFTIDFKGRGGWVTLNAATMIVIGEAVAVHVQDCFKREKALSDAITACTTVAEVAAIDITTGWPE